MEAKSPSRKSAPTPYISQKSHSLVPFDAPASPSFKARDAKGSVGSPAPPPVIVPRSIRERFVASTECGDAKDIAALLGSYDCGAFINAPEPLATGTDGWRVYNFSPCHYAAQNGHNDCLRILIEHGGDINLAADFGVTPLMVACLEGNVECARLILKSSSAVEGMHAKKPPTPRTADLLRGEAETAQALQQRPSAAFSIDQGDVYSKTAFSLAAHHGHVECMELLLAYGCCVNARDSAGRSVVHAAASRAENEEALRLLVTIPGVDINRPDQYGRTPLDLCPHRSVMEHILLAAGARPTADDDLVDEVRSCAFHSANARLRDILGEFECRGVIDRGDEGYLDWRTRGYCALQYAAQAGNVEAVEMLLGCGANPAAAQDEEGNAAFLLAANWGHCEVLTCLKQHHADVNVVNKHGQNAVFCAVSAGQKACLRVLLQKDEQDPIDFNRPDTDSLMTPLHLAARNSAESLMHLLIAAGAQVNLRDIAGFTPMGYTHTEACRKLLRQVGGV